MTLQETSSKDLYVSHVGAYGDEEYPFWRIGFTQIKYIDGYNDMAKIDLPLNYRVKRILL